MSGTEFLVNSDQSLEAFIADATERYEKDKYAIYTWVSGVKRTVPQNTMNFWLYKAIAEQKYGKDESFARAECKLTIGIPILRRDSEEFRAVYNKVILPHDYETKIEMVKLIQVSSLMNREQGIEYISLIFDAYASRGVVWPQLVIDQKGRMK